MAEAVNAETLARLLAEHGAALALYAAQWTAAADDCVQESLVELAALRSAPDRPAAWLYRRVKLRALNVARSDRRRRDREAEAWRERLVAAPGRADEAVELAEALASLTHDDRELVVLRFYGNLTLEELAEACGCSTSAAHRRLGKAIESLKQLLEDPPCDEPNHLSPTRPTAAN